jgi:hypothetical protein
MLAKWAVSDMGTSVNDLFEAAQTSDAEQRVDRDMSILRINSEVFGLRAVLATQPVGKDIKNRDRLGGILINAGKGGGSDNLARKEWRPRAERSHRHTEAAHRLRHVSSGVLGWWYVSSEAATLARGDTS